MAIRDKIPLNLDMMSNGYNWLILVLMVAIAGFGLALVFPSIAHNKGAS